MAWTIRYFNADVQRSILEFPAGVQARYIHLTQRMSAFGPDLGMPHTRPLGSGLFELRLKAERGIGRVFFGTISRQTIVMLHAIVKKTQKTPLRDIRIARRRLKEIGHADS
jgi:phage-related protein